jgi:hypothetical protein
VHVVVVHVVVVMMVMVVMMMHRLGHGSRSSGRSVLRHGIAGEAERKNSRRGKGLDHDGRTFLWLGTRTGHSHP